MMLIEGTVHLNKRLSTKQKWTLNKDRLITMLLFKPHKIHFQYTEPEIGRIFDMEDVYIENYKEVAINHMAGDLHKLVIYHTKKRFEYISDCVESYVVFLEGKTLPFT